MIPRLGRFVLVLLVGSLTLTRGDECDALLADLRAVKAEGAGSPKARAAFDRLTRRGPEVLPRILAAMEGAGPVAANWLRLAFDAIAERDCKKLDADALLAFAQDAKRDRRARRLALDLAESVRPGTREKLLPGWLDDPEFRYDAVEHTLARLAQAKEWPNEKMISAFREVFNASRDLEHARTAAARLKERGVAVSVARHLGFLGEWFVIGPFDGLAKKGFTTAYPPEKGVDTSAALQGKGGKDLRWRRVSVPEAPGGSLLLVDLRKPLGDADDAVAYAWTAFEVPAAREAELRGAADDNLSLWVNGEKVFAFEEYQNGWRLDRHKVKVKLRPGVNTILVKVCQAPLDPDNTIPAWEFLLRITDATGKGLTFPLAPAMR